MGLRTRSGKLVRRFPGGLWSCRYSDLRADVRTKSPKKCFAARRSDFTSFFSPLAGSSEAQNLVLLRLVRVLKSIRAIRMLRTFRFLKGLRFLVKACYCFLPSLGWSMLLLLVFICMGTLVLSNLLQEFIADESASMEDRQWVWERYGTSSRAMYTFYEKPRREECFHSLCG